MKLPLKILLLEDSPTDAEIIQRLLRKEKMHCEFRLVMDKKEFIKALTEFSPEVILSDNSMPQFSAAEALKITRQKFLHVPFILVTGTVSEEYAANIIKQGADDYILKDRLARLPSAIAAARAQRRALKEITDYKYALDQAAIVAITDQNGIIIYANQNFCNISKYSAEELIGQDHRIINSGYHPASYIKNLWDTIANGKIWRGEFRNKAKDGSFYWVDATIVPFLNENGKPYQYLSIRTDITEKKKAEEELKKSNERFQYATSATSDIIWELNFETKQYMVHEGKKNLFGFSKTLNWQLGIDGKNIIEEDRGRVRKSFREAKLDPTRELWEDEYRVYSEEKTILHIINHAIFIRDEKGKAIRVIGAITDITEKKKLETELLEQQRREQLKIIATTLEAQEKERDLIGQELHDNVNQILVGTKLFLSTVKDESEKNQAVIISCMEHIQHAIDENRKIAHALVTPDFETKFLAEQIVDVSENMLKVAGLDVTIDTTLLNETLLEEQQKLVAYRIVQEQCTNIIKYAKARSANISLSTSNDLFKMIIADDGAGMEAGKKTIGIGLKNIKGRLSIFNGIANIQTAPGKGFTLEITMPLKKRPANLNLLQS